MQAYTRGWQSQRFCTYPQEIVIGFPCKVHLKNINICFHEHKVPSKVELYEMDSVEDDVFNNSNDTNVLDISQRYPKLPKKEEKPEEIKNDTAGEDQAASSSQNDGNKSTTENTNDNISEQPHEQSVSKRMEMSNIQNAIQKGEEHAQSKQGKPVIENGDSSEDSNINQISSFELENEYMQRQQKSLEIGKEFKYIKIKCYDNHTNKLNVFNQIGIISIL